MRMDGQTIVFMGTAVAMLALMTAFALRCEAKTRAYKWARRAFWALAALWCGGAVGLSLNPFNAALVACFGAPAYAALWTLSLFP